MKRKKGSSELLQRLAFSGRCAFRGIQFVVRSQRNFRFHLAAALLVLGAALALRLSRLELVILVLTIGGVLSAELLNTALEVALNLVEARNHPVVAAAKDIAAGGVLLAAMVAAGVGCLLFGPRLLSLWGAR